MSYIVECSLVNSTDKFLGISKDVIFTALITMGIFVLGLRLNKKHDERKEFESLMGVKSYFLQLIEILINSSETQIKAFNIIVEHLKEKKENSFSFNFSSNFTTKYIDAIPTEKLFKIFISYKPIKAKKDVITLFKDTIVNLGLVRRFENEWEDSYKDFNNRNWKWNERYIESLMQVNDFTDRMIRSVENEQTLKQDAFLSQFLDIRTKWRKIDNYQDKFISEEHFINPLFQLCLKMPKDPRLLELLNPIRDCQYTFSNMKRTREEYERLFSHYHKGLADAITNIQKSLKEMEQYKDIRPGII